LIGKKSIINTKPQAWWKLQDKYEERIQQSKHKSTDEEIQIININSIPSKRKKKETEKKAFFGPRTRKRLKVVALGTTNASEDNTDSWYPRERSLDNPRERTNYYVTPHAP